jgi:hypothetical protein
MISNEPSGAVASGRKLPGLPVHTPELFPFTFITKEALPKFVEHAGYTGEAL